MIALHETNNSQESIALIVEKINHAIDLTEGPVLMALAGGNTPKALYQTMNQQDWPWARLQFTLTDERWVDENDAMSNAAMVRHTLLKDCAQPAYFLPLKNQELTPLLGQQLCETQLVTQMPKLDRVVLGMGEDGHFASIFSGMDHLDEALDIENSALCMAAVSEERQGQPALNRMTLTLSYLVSANEIYLLCTGIEKKAVLDAVLSNQGGQYPVQSLVNKCRGQLTNTELHIYWSEQ